MRISDWSSDVCSSDLEEARGRGEALLARLNIPAAMWELAPATFSGGEQQRVNIARGFVANFPILLLDEPTASLDAGNRAVVVELMREAKARGAAIVGIFHDEEVREAVADRVFDLSRERRHRKSVVEGKGVYVRLDFGARRIIQKNN